MNYVKLSDDRNVLPSRISRSVVTYSFPESRTFCELHTILTNAKYDTLANNGLWTARQQYYELKVFNTSQEPVVCVYRRLHSTRSHALVDMQDYLISNNLFNPSYKVVEISEDYD